MTRSLPLHIAFARAGTAAAYDTDLLGQVTPVQNFRRWLQDEGDNLIAAVQLLGGPEWAKRAARVVTAARSDKPLTASHNMIKALSRLLHGNHASDIDSFEAWPFTWLHPDDPRATNAMRCADALDAGLRAINAQRAARSGPRPVRAQ